MRCWRVVIGGWSSEGYQVIGHRVVEETPAESGWCSFRCDGCDEAARARARSGQ